MNVRTPYLACAASLAIGVFFVAVWAPHPWGWGGIDRYHDLALALARGEGFQTTDVPWGYAYFLAPFYRVFGDRPWIPLLVQVALNASMPLLVYHYARLAFDARVAAVAALLTGVFSFNTVYASTQASDSICNVLFMSAILTFVSAHHRGSTRGYAAAGVLTGVAMQFRPNLLLVPLLLAAYAWFVYRRRSDRTGAIALSVAAAMTLLPWIVRNYRLTGEFLPTSTHGGQQLWYGSLQTGPYLESRAHNPRSAFELAPFPYTSLDRVPLVFSGTARGCRDTSLVFWTDRDATRRQVALAAGAGNRFQVDVPNSPAPTTYYYQFADASGAPARTDAVGLFFVSGDHLGDMDRHGDLLDAFDVVRIARHIAWNDPVGADVDLDGSGAVDEADLDHAVNRLLGTRVPPGAAARVRPRLRPQGDAVALDLGGDSEVVVPRNWSGRITDLAVRGETAAALVQRSAARARNQSNPTVASGGCFVHAEVNEVFYRREPNDLRRYVALARDNIERDPRAFLASVAYRAVRVFLIEGTNDPHTTHQFEGSGRIYRLAFIGSAVVFGVFLVGVWCAWRAGAAIGLPLVLIAYIPATLAFVLTNMRYSITVQPLMLIFVASALVSASEAAGWPAPHRAEIETARRP